MSEFVRIESISQLHAGFQIPSPYHPLLSVVNFDDVTFDSSKGGQGGDQRFLSIALKTIRPTTCCTAASTDFAQGSMLFMALQVYRIMDTIDEHLQGWDCTSTPM